MSQISPGALFRNCATVLQKAIRFQNSEKKRLQQDHELFMSYLGYYMSCTVNNKQSTHSKPEVNNNDVHL